MHQKVYYVLDEIDIRGAPSIVVGYVSLEKRQRGRLLVVKIRQTAYDIHCSNPTSSVFHGRESGTTTCTPPAASNPPGR